MAIHDHQLAEHGGPRGIRDLSVIQSALARPINLWNYDESPERPDVATLAAAYAYGLARNHGFIDGNKRVAFVVAAAFLDMNGHELDTDDEKEIVRVMLAVAAGEMSEAELGEWFRKYI